jgi:hypothetical protein
MASNDFNSDSLESSFNTLSRELASSFNPYIDKNHFSTTLQNVCHGISIIQDMDTECEGLRETTYIGINSHCQTLKAALDWESNQPARNNKLDLNAEVRAIQSRDDLSFTSRDGEGRLNNWDVLHDRNGNWSEGLVIGEKYFDEIRQLALFDEIEAFHAIEFAMNSGHWQSSGWGIEMGFTRALAKAAMLGMRQLQQGAVEFDEAAHTN